VETAGGSDSHELMPCRPPNNGSDDDFEEYTPFRGNCDDGIGDGNGNGVPCASADLRMVCDKYSNE